MSTTPAVRALIHELANPLTVLMSISDILHHRVPDPIVGPVDQLRKISHQFGQDVIELRASLHEHIDLQCSKTAAGQIRQQAALWRDGYAARLAPLADQIQGAAIHLPEPLLNRMLNDGLPQGLDELVRVLSRLESIQPGDLDPPEYPQLG